MRPEILFPLFQPVTTIPGVGPRIAGLIARVAGPRKIDLCFKLPTGLVDRRFSPSVAEAPDGRIATFTLVVEEHRPPRPAPACPTRSAAGTKPARSTSSSSTRAPTIWLRRFRSAKSGS